MVPGAESSASLRGTRMVLLADVDVTNVTNLGSKQFKSQKL